MRRFFCGVIFLGITALTVRAEDSPWLIQGQSTLVEQYHPAFNAPYSGPMSLESGASSRETADLTLFVGRRLWSGAEAWISPEIDQGFGLNNTSGVAGYLSGEAYKMGSHTPYLRLQRLFVRQHLGISGESVEDEEDLGRFRSEHSSDELVLTLGRFSVADIFDNNRYAHDPREDFFNWSVIESGAFDYAADPWGVTQGLSVEWVAGRNTARLGLFEMSAAPNGKVLGVHLAHQMWVAENERRYDIAGQPGAIRLLGYLDDASMASYADAVAIGVNNLPSARRSHQKTGFAVNLEQQWSERLGVFMRYSANDGRYETFEFTDINRSLAVGLQATMREQDRVGVALVRNDLSSEAIRFFKAGGLGVLIGDGQLTYAPEYIAEFYYAWRFLPRSSLTFDFQDILHPAYNQARGPVTVWGVRLHTEF